MSFDGERMFGLTIAIRDFHECDMPTLKKLAKQLEIFNQNGVTSEDINRLTDAIELQNEIAKLRLNQRPMQK